MPPSPPPKLESSPHGPWRGAKALRRGLVSWQLTPGRAGRDTGRDMLVTSGLVYLVGAFRGRLLARNPGVWDIPGILCGV